MGIIHVSLKWVLMKYARGMNSVYSDPQCKWGSCLKLILLQLVKVRRRIDWSYFILLKRPHPTLINEIKLERVFSISHWSRDLENIHMLNLSFEKTSENDLLHWAWFLCLKMYNLPCRPEHGLILKQIIHWILLSNSSRRSCPSGNFTRAVTLLLFYIEETWNKTVLHWKSSSAPGSINAAPAPCWSPPGRCAAAGRWLSGSGRTGHVAQMPPQ